MSGDFDMEMQYVDICQIAFAEYKSKTEDHRLKLTYRKLCSDRAEFNVNYIGDILEVFQKVRGPLMSHGIRQWLMKAPKPVVGNMTRLAWQTS